MYSFVSNTYTICLYCWINCRLNKKNKYIVFIWFVLCRRIYTYERKTFFQPSHIFDSLCVNCKVLCRCCRCTLKKNDVEYAIPSMKKKYQLHQPSTIYDTFISFRFFFLSIFLGFYAAAFAKALGCEKPVFIMIAISSAICSDNILELYWTFDIVHSQKCIPFRFSISGCCLNSIFYIFVYIFWNYIHIC